MINRRRQQVPIQEERRNSIATPKTPTWRWVAELAIALILLITGAFLSETRNDVKSLAVTKLDKDAYYRDVGEIKAMITEMRSDIKELAKRRE